MVLPKSHRRNFRSTMTSRQKIRFSCFTLEGLNSFATILYFNYLYFLMRDWFGFDNKHNLAFAAYLGVIYVPAAWQAGKFGQRHGYFTALKIGFSIMAISLVAGLLLKSISGQVISASCLTIGMCFIWPTLEALVSNSETAERLPNVVGLYNVVWAVTNAVAFFIGGSLIERFGYKIIFALPLGIVLFQLALTFWLHHHATEMAREALSKPKTDLPPEPHRPASPRAKIFLKMAWLSNPFSYIAINTLIAVVPGIAHKFDLSPMLAG